MKIDAIGIVTKDRPGSLAAMLPGYLENCLSFGRKASVIVADDSRNPATQAANRGTLRLLSRRYGVAGAYAGIEEKRRFAEKLAGAGLPRDVIEFALFGLPGTEPTMGANRNALLLQTAGEGVFCVDDDVFCRLAETPNRRPTPSAIEPGAPEYWFFGDHAEALARAPIAPRQDLMDGHERFLGSKNPRGKVWATLNGIVGDCALSSVVDLSGLKGDSLKRLQDGDKAVSRQVLRAAHRESTGAAGDFTAIAFGLDNRVLTPPFMPSFRYEDGMFAATMDKCFGGCVVHLPWALLHVPPETRTFQSECYRGIAAVSARINYFIVEMCLQPFQPPSQVPEENLRALGRSLCEFAGLPDKEFRDLAGRRLRRLLSMELLILERRLRGREWEGFPRRRLDQHMANLAALIDSRKDLLSSSRGQVLGWQTWKELINRFGLLLQAWPDIVGAARRLRLREIVPA